MLFEAAGVEVEPKMAKTEQESQLGANLELILAYLELI